VAGCTSADPDYVFPPWGSIKLGVKSDYSLDLAGSHPQGFGDLRHHLLREITKALLNLLQERD
jgi:hypothetical protein